MVAAGRAAHPRPGGHGRSARAVAGPARRDRRADHGDGPDRAGRQPHLRHRTRPARAAEVRSGTADGADGRTAAAARASSSSSPAMRSVNRSRPHTVWATRLRRCAPSAAGRWVSAGVGVLHRRMERAPRRQQPGYSWLAFGSGVSLALWLLLTGLLALYVVASGSFGSTYGPLTGNLRPAAVGEPVVGRIVPRGRVRRTARGGSRGRAGTDVGRPAGCTARRDRSGGLAGANQLEDRDDAVGALLVFGEPGARSLTIS